jgi:nitric oxide reductase subunit B
MHYRRLWIGLGVVVAASFAVLIYYGVQIYQTAPPVPNQVVTTAGVQVYDKATIQDGQRVWQSTGGQELGSVWGHGAYVAPDWSADFLHRESMYILDHWAVAEGAESYGALNHERQDGLKARLRTEMRTNTYDPATGTITISPLRAAAIADVSAHYTALFMNDPSMAELREAYAMKTNTIKDPQRMRQLNAFYWWSAWACTTNRPGAEVTYTNNWPSESLVGNVPTAPTVVWSVLSFVVLLAGIGALSWYFASQRQNEDHKAHDFPVNDPLLGLNPTPSMQATLKYFYVVTALIVFQILAGVVAAHYGVEGSGFYGFPLSDYLPYSVARTWHTQIGIFWIATAWLATGLFLAPAVSGYEPKFQKLGVNFLFICLLIIVVGSMVGQWLGVMQQLGLDQNFWFGHQGLEYVDLGRFWQIFLLVGLFVWLALMSRALWPALMGSRHSIASGGMPPDGGAQEEGRGQRHLLGLFLISSLAIAGFYGAGLAYGQRSNYAVMEYWRWWVVHLWVEGFFEVFATVVIAFLFTRMGLLRTATATAAVLFSTIIFLSGGIIGTFHHLYFTGTPMGVLAFGATFSALEVVPLVLIGFEAYENLTLSRVRPWVQAYKWPIYFFVGVAFWNLVGAGLFGFLINPPIALYYMQGLNTTAVHSHAALFGVYGLLGMGLMLFCMKGLIGKRIWKTGVLGFAFWAINIGLALMILLSLLPVGMLQTWASVQHGLWYARSAEFMQTPIMDTLRWLRVVGDTIFAVGAIAFGWFILGLKTGWSLEPGEYQVLQDAAEAPEGEREMVQ